MAMNRSVSFPNPLLSGSRGTKNRILLITIGVCWLILINFIMSFVVAESRSLTSETTGVVKSSQSYHMRKHKQVCKLTVEYIVKDKVYSGVGIDGNSKSDCKYNPGSEVKISYNPVNPEKFTPTIDKTAYKFIFFLNNFIGIIFIGGGVFGALMQKPVFASKVKSIFTKS